MSISSMTGYALVNAATGTHSITIELRSVNSRFLDLQFRLNDELRAFEPLLREAISARVTRSKLECRLTIAHQTGDAALRIDQTLLQRLTTVQAAVLEKCPNAQPFSVNELLRWPGMVEEDVLDPQVLQNGIRDALGQALDAFIDCRQREGGQLCDFLLARLNDMQATLERIAPLVPQQIAAFQQKAVARMQEALGLTLAGGEPVGVDEALERVRQEVTLYGIKIDVTEELDRMKAHLQETAQILKKGGAVGKRLDFMMQELNREANTLGSKSAVKDLSDASMALKMLIEQMREQVQNLE